MNWVKVIQIDTNRFWASDHTCEQTVGGESQCKFDFSHRVEEVPEETDSVVANEVSDAEIGSTASAEQFYDSLLAAIDRLEESNYVEEESCYMKGGDCRHVFVQLFGVFFTV